MKDVPLLFTTTVPAILDGRKTATRRLGFHGKAGDRIWCRETWAPGDLWLDGNRDRDPPHCIRYKADGGALFWGRAEKPPVVPAGLDTWTPVPEKSWRSPLFLPKWAARIWLKVIEVRQEPLQAMTESDCRAEGAPDEYYIHPFDWFIPTWNDMHAKRGHGWAENPTVHVVTFKVIAPESAKLRAEARAAGGAMVKIRNFAEEGLANEDAKR
jgi:hypothetical protein